MSFVRFQMCLAVLAVAMSGHAVFADESANQVDTKLLEKLPGDWYPVSSIFDGKKREIDPEQEMFMTIEGRKMSLKIGDKLVTTFEIKHLVAKERLAHLNFEFVDPLGNTIKIKQLWKLEGDTLTTCGVAAKPDAERPSELASPEGSGILLTVFKRRKQEAAEKKDE